MGADVYHKKSFEELLKHSRDTEGAVARLQAIENATWPQDYDFVATVDTDNLEVAFELTNSIDCAWWTNAKVISRFEDNGCRSTKAISMCECGLGGPSELGGLSSRSCSLTSN